MVDVTAAHGFCRTRPPQQGAGNECWVGLARPLGVARMLTSWLCLSAKYQAREAALKAQSERKPGGEREDRGKLPESPKRAEEIWQQSVIGDYLARFKVAESGEGSVYGL